MEFDLVSFLPTDYQAELGLIVHVIRYLYLVVQSGRNIEIKSAVVLQHCWRGANNKELLQTQHTWTSSSFQLPAMLLGDFSAM